MSRALPGGGITRVVVSRSLAGAVGVVESQSAAIGFLLFKNLHAFHGTFDIDEVGMCETTRLSGASINGNSDVDDVSDTTEQIAQITIGHLK